MRILIADDHAMIRQGLRMCLQEIPGTEVVGEASDGLEAFEKACELQPDLVVMDIAMPRVNGIDAARNIREDDRCAATAVVVLSMHTEREFVAEAFRAGARAYILKSSAFEELAQAVEALREGKTYISPDLSDVFVDQMIRGNGAASPLPFTELTSRERQVLQLLADGNNAKQIGDLLNVSDKTVHAHRAAIMQKLNLHSVAELTKYAIRHGLSALD
jgi:DNA-binding NarL/FixJ family response regulator